MNNYIKRIFITLGILACMSQGFSQNLSNKGKDFWVGYGIHQFMETGQNNSQEMVLYFSAEQAANVTVTIDGTAYIRNYAVPANTVIASEFLPKSGPTDARLISLPCSFVPPGFPCGGEGVFSGKGIHIVSDVPIVAYAHIWGSASSGATMLMPVETWGYAYTTLNSIQNYQPNCFSWLYVIAQHDNTLIEVTPAAITRTGKPAGTPFTVLLNRGQIYQTMAGPEAGSAKPEMSGSKIKSITNSAGTCYPIAVFAGSSRTSNPFSCGSLGGDNDNQQCFPSQAWGKRYLTAPTSSSVIASTFMTNMYKIAVKDPTTVVKRNGVQLPLGTLINNAYYKFESNTADYIEADKPIMVAQFMTGGTCMNGGVGDPEMMYISPIEQGIKRIGFYRNDDENITVNYLTLIIPTNGVPSLRIDGSATFDHSYPHPQLSGYTVVVKRWSASKSQSIAYSDSAFTAITYGLGSVESYGYNAGTLINNLSAVGEIQNTMDPATPSHPFTCDKTPLKLSMLVAYQPTRMVWKLSALAGNLNPAVDVIDNAPVSVGTATVNGLTYYKYTLPGTYTFNNIGTHRIYVDCTHPSIEKCDNTEELFVEVEVRGKPWTQFSTTHTGCRLDSVHLTSPSTSSNGFNITQWNWTFPGAVTSTLQNPAALISAIGSQNISLQIVSSEGCVGDTIKPIVIFDRPTTNFTPTPASTCEGGTISFSDVSSYGGTAPINAWYWDFGNGNTLTPGNGNPQTSTYPTYGVYTVKHVVGVSSTCISDTITKTVTIYAKPRPTFTYPAGCLPANGIVQFTSSTTVPDGQALNPAGYLWNFGDPNATVPNPNTSTLPNPTHFYSAFGNYTITFSATTVNGCTKDTVVNATFNLRPVLDYPALPAVCINTTSAVSVATASVTNGVPGSGIYVGPGTDAAGNFNPVTAGTGTHTIWYKYTTNAGCTDSISRTILVRAKPKANFSIPSGLCLPPNGQVSFTNTSTISDGQGLTYAWNFNDPNATAGNPNTSTATNPSHIFQEGTYNILLTVTTANGCVGDTTITTTLSIKPALTYPVLASRCQNETTPVSVATASVTNGVTGTGVYSGPGTDAAGNFTPSLAGIGTHTIKYVFTTAGGCKDSVTQTILVRAKPRANFTFTNPTCLPTTGLVSFTNGTTIADAQTMTYAWNFNDPNATGSNPNTSTSQNPTHKFLEGTFNILLTATTNNGCIGDTTIPVTFSVKPALTYPVLTSKCQNETTPVSIATASVTNGVTGTGVYSGPGTDASGNFTPSLAGVGTHTIKYVFTTAGGCKDSVTQTILVRAKPRANFTFTNPTCLPTTGLVSFTNGTTIADAQTMTYAWNFNDPNATGGNPNTSTAQNPTHNFLEGTFNIVLTATTNNGCIGDTTIPVTFSVKPALTYPALTSRCQNETTAFSIATATVTNGVTGTGVYSGPGTDAAGNFTPSLAGFGTHTIKYVFTTTGGCKDSVTQTIAVRAKPRANFTFTNPTCLPTTGLVSFTNGTTIADAQTMTYAWNFNDPNATGGNPNTSTAQNPTHNFLEGTFNIVLTATTNTGCVGDTTIPVTFSVKPALTYPALTSRCQNETTAFSIATAAVTNGVTGTGVYSGPGTDAAGNFTPSLAGFGTHTIKYVFTTAGGCKDSVTQTIAVRAKPRANFTFTNPTCLPTTGLVSFTNGTTIADAQTMTYAWNFNDPNATGGNPNTSTAQNPTHNFLEGTFNIVLTATTNTGCVGDTTIPVTFSVKPALAFAPLTNRCENIRTAVSVATGTVTNGVTGTALYTGPGTDAAGNFTPSLAGPGLHTIWYKFTTAGGCKDSLSRTIRVNPKPTAAFTVNSDICLNQSATISNQSTILTGSISNWNWNFGDGNSVSNTNGNAFTKPYATFGNYTIKLVAVSDSGCVSDTVSHPVAVHAMPVTDFSMPASVCMPNGPVAFVNNTTIADNASMIYRWNFGDASAPSSAVNPSHTYAAIGNYSITLRATSSFGCFKDTTKTFDKFFDKPIADFNVTPDNLCQGATNTFTDLSTAPNSTIQVWNWDFADGSNATDASPVKLYTRPGNYAVKLTVTNAVGCVSDVFTKTVIVNLQPEVDAGPSFIVPQNSIVRFAPIVNDSVVVQFLWTPTADFSNPAKLKQVITATHNQTYTLTATGAGGCTDSDTMFVKILKPFTIPNAFSPNGDGINDTWIIRELDDYPGATVSVFNRYGQVVFSSNGYPNAWDGTTKGKPLPFATYYYIIKLENGFEPLSGSVTIVK